MQMELTLNNLKALFLFDKRCFDEEINVSIGHIMHVAPYIPRDSAGN